MITFEETLGRLVDLFPPLTDANTNDFKIHYNWGTQEVLNKYLKMYKDAVYPLVWLINSTNTENEQTKRINRSARIVIATKSNAVNEFNPYQYQNDFLNILNPVKKNLLKAIRASGISQLTNENYKYSFIPNYSYEDSEGTLIDVWNAIVIDLEVEFRTDYTCINAIIF